MEIWPRLVSQLLLPPGVLLFFIILGLALAIKWKLAGGLIIATGVASLFALSLPLTGHWLISQLESAYPALTPDQDTLQPNAEAIVVLGMDRYADAPEYGADTVSSGTLVRLRYAAHLHKITGLPILLAGGTPNGEAIAEAVLMHAAMQTDFGLDPEWTEAESRNTFENALNANTILSGPGIERIYLVTHAWHMPRAVWSFSRAGLIAIPAPTGFTTRSKQERNIHGLLPSAKGLWLSSLALRERLGLAWYRLKYASEAAHNTDNTLPTATELIPAP